TGSPRGLLNYQFDARALLDEEFCYVAHPDAAQPAQLDAHVANRLRRAVGLAARRGAGDLLGDDPGPALRRAALRHTDVLAQTTRASDNLRRQSLHGRDRARGRVSSCPGSLCRFADGAAASSPATGSQEPGPGRTPAF